MTEKGKEKPIALPKTATNPINQQTPYGTNSTSQHPTHLTQQYIATHFVGPTPPPHYLEQYERLVQGTAKRFLDEPHIEAEHRRSLEKN